MKTDIDIDDLIEKSLKAARVSIEELGTCAFVVHVVYPGGVRSVMFLKAPSTPAEEREVHVLVDPLAAELKSHLMILIADKWIGEVAPNSFVAMSPDIPLSNRHQALVVEIWASGVGLVKCGMQRYSRCAGGQVHFEEFVWGDVRPQREDALTIN